LLGTRISDRSSKKEEEKKGIARPSRKRATTQEGRDLEGKRGGGLGKCVLAKKSEKTGSNQGTRQRSGRKIGSAKEVERATTCCNERV